MEIPSPSLTDGSRGHISQFRPTRWKGLFAGASCPEMSARDHEKIKELKKQKHNKTESPCVLNGITELLQNT